MHLCVICIPSSKSLLSILQIIGSRNFTEFTNSKTSSYKLASSLMRITTKFVSFKTFFNSSKVDTERSSIDASCRAFYEERLVEQMDQATRRSKLRFLYVDFLINYLIFRCYFCEVCFLTHVILSLKISSQLNNRYAKFCRYFDSLVTRCRTIRWCPEKLAMLPNSFITFFVLVYRACHTFQAHPLLFSPVTVLRAPLIDSIRLLTRISLRRWAFLHSLIIDLNDSQSVSSLASVTFALTKSDPRYSKIGIFFLEWILFQKGFVISAPQTLTPNNLWSSLANLIASSAPLLPTLSRVVYLRFAFPMETFHCYKTFCNFPRIQRVISILYGLLYRLNFFSVEGIFCFKRFLCYIAQKNFIFLDVSNLLVTFVCRLFGIRASWPIRLHGLLSCLLVHS